LEYLQILPFYFIFDQIRAVLVNIRDFFKNITLDSKLLIGRMKILLIINKNSRILYFFSYAAEIFIIFMKGQWECW